MFSFSFLLHASFPAANRAFDIRVRCPFDFENSIRSRLLSRKINTSAASVASHHLLHESPGVSWQSPYFTCPAVSARIRSQFRAAALRLMKTLEDLRIAKSLSLHRSLSLCIFSFSQSEAENLPPQHAQRLMVRCDRAPITVISNKVNMTWHSSHYQMTALKGRLKPRHVIITFIIRLCR